MDQNTTCTYIISLIRSLLKDIQPPEKPNSISFEDIYKMAKKHHVRNMCFYAIEKLNEKPEQQLYEKWKQYVSVSEAQSAMQLSEIDRVISALQSAEIDCLPLKGCFLKAMYPKPEYREMADLDILVRPDSLESVRNVMESIGYHLSEHEDFLIHDTYFRPPFMSVEIHKQLLTESFAEQNHFDISSLSIMADPWKYAHETDRKHVYAFSAEDTYIFLILHLAKHYFGSGSGIRQFTDIWVYNQNVFPDKEYINRMLKKIGMDYFCLDTENLVRAWYEGTEMTTKLNEMQHFVFSSGAYGNEENRIRNKISSFHAETAQDKGKLAYFFYRLFPSLTFMKKHYAYVNRFPLLLPAGWIHRLIRTVFGKRSPAVRELRALIKVIKKSNSDK